jgi:phage gpG-like protein
MITVCALLGTALGALTLALSSHRVGVWSAPAHPRQNPFRSGGLLSLPLAAQGVVSAAIGADSSAYRAHASAQGFHATNPAQGMQASFDRSGAQIDAGSLRVGLRLAAIGYGDQLQVVPETAPTATRNDVTYRRHGFSEWYANGPLGVEQGFTIARRPQGSVARPLTLAITLSGNAHVSVGRNGETAYLRHGRDLLRYTGLSVSDARGRDLHSWLARQAGRILLEVDAAGAAYPLRVDPFVQQGSSLAGDAEVWRGNFGGSVALSSDGDTALIGAPQDEYSGAAYVFTRSGSTWTQQAKLTAAGEAGASIGFGASVALSGNGKTALVGAPGYGARTGAVWVFTRSGTAWCQQQQLTGAGHESEGRFGASVALSADGTTALIGSPDEYRVIDSHGIYDAGAAYVFTHPGTTWVQQGEKLTGTEEVYPEQYAVIIGSGFGESVALSGDGNTALIGGPKDNEYRGAVWSFTRSGESWAQQGKKITAQGGSFGETVAMSSDASTAVIGAPSYEGFAGAAWVLGRTEGEWSKQAELKGTPGEFAYFGSSLALSEDGNTALVGSPTEQNYVGAAWAFSRKGGVWDAQCEHLTAADESGEGRYGDGVALSSGGDTALIGAPLDEEGSGMAQVLVASPPPAGAAEPRGGAEPSCAAGAPEPTVATLEASNITATSATLNATVDPDGGEVTGCRFEYGTTPAYGTSVPCLELPGSGTSSVAVSATLSGLSEGAIYHYRIVATNEGGISTGSDQAFTPPTVGTGIAGTVTSASTRAPIEGIEVCAYEEASEGLFGECTLTDASGRYALARLTAGEYLVEFSSPESGALNYVRQYYDGKSLPEEAEAVPVAADSLTEGINAQLEEGGRVTGKVTSASTRAAIDRALVCAFTADDEIEACALSNLSGEYAIAGLLDGRYKIGVDAAEAGYAIQYYDDELSLSRATLVPVVAGEIASGIDAQLIEGGRIAGRVTSASSGAPIAGILVCAFESSAEIEECAITGESGEYLLAGLPAGEYAVDFNGGKTYASQYYDDASSPAAARPVPVVAGSMDSGIDASMQANTRSVPPPPPPTPPLPRFPVPGGGSTNTGSGSVASAPPASPTGGGVLGSTSVGIGSIQIGALLRQELTPAGKTAKFATLLAGGGFTVTFKGLVAGTAVIDWYQLPPGAKLAKKTRAKPILVASGQMRFATAGVAKIKVKLTGAGRRLLEHAKILKLTAKGTFTPTGKTPVTATKEFVLKQ